MYGEARAENNLLRLKCGAQHDVSALPRCFRANTVIRYLSPLKRSVGSKTAFFLENAVTGRLVRDRRSMYIQRVTLVLKNYPEYFLLAIVLTIAFHAFLVFRPRGINVLFLLTAVYIVISPVSGASMGSDVFTGQTQLFAVGMVTKFVRVYVTLLIALIAVTGYGIHRLRPASVMLMAFALFFAGAALWSTAIIWGLFHKGLFALSVFCGIVLPYSLKNESDLIRGVRLFGVVALIVAGYTLFQFFMSPGATITNSRLAAIGINPNRVGATCASLIIPCLFLVLYDRHKVWKILSYIGGASLGLSVLCTGSRGAAAVAVVGIFFLLLPLIKRPLVVAVLLGATGAIGFFVLTNFEIAGANRVLQIKNLESGEMVNVTEIEDADQLIDSLASTRSMIWGNAVQRFKKNPILGVGWMHSPSPFTVNCHNMYLQTAAETGLVGLTFLVITAIVLAGYWMRAARTRRRYPGSIESEYFAAAIIMAMLVHGLGESATVLGSAVNPILLGFAVGLIDHIPRLARQSCQRVFPEHNPYGARSLVQQPV